MSKLIVSLSTNRSTASLNRDFQRSVSVKYPVLNAIVNFVVSFVSGGELNRTAIVAIDEAATAASGTITFSGVGAANDTILINGNTFTAKASGATGDQWNVGGTATLSAANLAAAINASATAIVNQQVTASSAGAVVTITSVVRGVYGNAVTLAKGVDAGSVMTVSGARLTGGAADPNSATYTF